MKLMMSLMSLKSDQMKSFYCHILLIHGTGGIAYVSEILPK